MSEVVVRLSEWERCAPDPGTPLAGMVLEGTTVRALAQQLSASGKLKVLELAQGIAIHTTSFVGRVRLGRLRITVQPKIAGMPLLNLLRYAYGLRHLNLFPHTGYDDVASSFQDLLIHQLAAETAELVARGLHREYERTTQTLVSPLGRLDFQAYARQGGTSRAALPCIHHPRLAATLINQVLLAGLHLGVRLTGDLPLRARLRRLAQILEIDITPARLNADMLAHAEQALDRRTVAYRPALTLVALLLRSAGLLLDEKETGLRLPGFLFDMNRFFQALLARFLQDYLAEYTIYEEYRLKGMLTYVPGHNPRHRRAPEPRPDYVIQQGARPVALLDAKYRDLWEHSLPREMLYQLAIYALSQGPEAKATILYPTLHPGAKEACIAVRDPLYSVDRAYVVLRPVNLVHLEHLISDSDGHRKRQVCETFARYLVFGEES